MGLSPRKECFYPFIWFRCPLMIYPRQIHVNGLYKLEYRMFQMKCKESVVCYRISNVSLIMINKRQLRRLCLIFLVLIVFLKSQKVINNSIKPSLFVSGWGKFHGWRISKPVARDGDISCPSLLIVSYSICLGKCVEIHYNSCWKMVFCAFNWYYWLNRIRKNSHKEWYYSSFLSQKTINFVLITLIENGNTSRVLRALLLVK